MAIVSMVSEESQISVNVGPIGVNGKGLRNVLQFAILDSPCLTSRKNKLDKWKKISRFIIQKSKEHWLKESVILRLQQN